MSQDLSDRVTRVEQQVETHDDVLDRVTETLDRLVRFTVRHEKTKERVTDNENRVDEVADEVSDLRGYIKSRWYVAVTVVSIVVVLAQIAASYL